jgi:ABC-2 type transport system ATP-binding protein
MKVLEIENLTKIYRKSIKAVDKLSLDIGEAEIFGLLGPNGAGKTSVLNMIVGLISPTEGEIQIFGEQINSSDIEIRRRIGYLPEDIFLPDYYRVGQILNFYGSLFGIPLKEQNRRIEYLLSNLELLSKIKEKIRNLSMGQKRALGLAISLIGDPDLILLDEPTVYLDPLITTSFRKIILGLKEKKKTVVISSHILSEIERTCDRVGIIDKGRLLSLGETKDLIGENTLDEVFLKIIKH